MAVAVSAVTDPTGYGFWAIAERDPERVALVDAGGEPVTFGALCTRARGLGRALHELGLTPGDALAVVVGNEPAFFEAILAAMELGWYVVPVNTHLAPVEVAHVVADSDAKAVVVSEDLVDLVTAAADTVGLPPAARIVAGSAPGYRPLAEARLTDGPLPERRPGATMMYTSGTTGKPKGVRRPLPAGDPNELAARVALVTAQGFGVEPGAGVHLTCGPLYHAGPFVGAMNALHVGHRIVLMERWTAEGFLQHVEHHRVTNTQVVPTMLHRLLALPEPVRAAYDVSSLRSVFHTGAPCPADVKAAIMAWWGPIVWETYGGTEAAATIATPKRWLERPGTVGRAIRGVTVHILDDDGEPCPPGVPGSIYIESEQGDQTAYFKDDEKTRSMRRGRMVTLGDIGYLDDDGFLFLCDRKVDMIISGGVNIYPAEVEAVLLTHPDVADVAVIGVPDAEWGEQVLAVVELVDGVAADPTTEARLAAHCEEALARFKRPRRYEFTAVLPRLPNGKVEKRRLREPYWQAVDRAI